MKSRCRTNSRRHSVPSWCGSSRRTWRTELGDRDRGKLGLDTAANEITRTRERWAEMSNWALEKAQVSERIDHRSLKDQGIEREPTHHWGAAIAGILERGERSTVAERWQQEAN